LYPDQIAEADELAKQRNELAIAIGRTPRNKAPEGTRSFEINRLGARCEFAGHVYFPHLEWHKFTHGSVDNLPDLGNTIDIKGIPLHNLSLLVQLDGNPNRAYVSISSQDHPIYVLKGWQWGHVIMKECHIDNPLGDRPAYFYKGELKPMTVLYELSRAPGF
jgi:hypothetical protein